MTAESDIKREVMVFLNALPRAYFRVIQVSGIRGRKSMTKGVLDIVGCYNGRAVAIEIKTPTGKLEESQREFITAWLLAGGIAFVARSVADVIRFLEIEDKTQTHPGVRAPSSNP